MEKNAILALEDGTLLKGKSVGADGYFVGELVFNTSMTGYQEILTDPSYAGQIISFTYPHIGNVGVNPEDMESARIWAKGIVMRKLSKYSSNHRATNDLQIILKKQGIITISDIDTRQLTRILRSKGNLKACIMGGEIDTNFALKKAKEFAGIKGQDLAPLVSSQKSYEIKSKNALHVVVLDFGVKAAILNQLAKHCSLTIVPGNTKAASILKLNPNGILLSNGPGDPAAMKEAIETIQTLLEYDIPTFGICLGHQLLGLASGATTGKMKNGHHGSNHPILELNTNKVYISSQNHGFTIDTENLPSCLHTTHKSLFDGSIAGIARNDKPAFGFQGHPEASPGPNELHSLFQKFISLMESHYAQIK